MLGFHGTHARLAFFTPQAQWSREQPLHVVLCFLLRSRSLWRGTIGRSAAAPPRRSRQTSGPRRGGGSSATLARRRDARARAPRAHAQPLVRRRDARPRSHRCAAHCAAGGALRRARVVQRHEARAGACAPRRGSGGVLSIGRSHSAREVVQMAEGGLSTFARPWRRAPLPHVRGPESGETLSKTVAVVDPVVPARAFRPEDGETAVVVRAIHGQKLSHWRAIQVVSQ